MPVTLKSIFNEFIINGLIVGVLGGALLTFFNENLNVLRTTFLIASAQRKLKSGNPKRIKRGVQILLEIAMAKPFRRQEMVDIIVKECFRRYFDRNDPPSGSTPPPLIEVFVDTLKAVLNIPRKDENDHLLNIDLHRLRLVSEAKSVYLENMNFNGVELWGCDFVNIDFSRSTFEQANLGGVLFRKCGLEFTNMNHTRINYSFLDNRPTTIIESQLAGSTIEKAAIFDYPNATPGSQLQIIHTDLEPWVREKLEKNRSVRIIA